MDVRLANQLGSAIRAVRTAKRWTQAEAAEALSISPEFFGRLERGTTLPSAETLSRLVQVLDLSFDAVARGTKPRAPKPPPRAVHVLVERIHRQLPRLPVRALRLVSALIAELTR